MLHGPFLTISRRRGQSGDRQGGGRGLLHLEARAKVDVALLEALGQLGGHSEVVGHRLAAVLGAAEEHLQVAVVGAHVQQREDLRA